MRVGVEADFSIVKNTKKQFILSEDEGREKIICPEEKCILPGIKISFDDPITIKHKKYIQGHTNTELYLSALEINTKDEVILEKVNINSNESSGELIIKNGKVVFRDVYLSGIQIKLVAGEVIFENDVTIENVDRAIVFYSGKVNGLENVTFENVNTDWEISDEESKKWLKIENFLGANRKLEFYFQKSNEIVLKKPVLVLGFELTFLCPDKDGKGKILSTEPNAFSVTNGGILKLKNVEISGDDREKKIDNENSEEAKALISADSNSELMLKNCIVQNGLNAGIFINSSKAYILESIIRNNKRTGLKIAQSNATLQDINVSENKKNGITIDNQSDVEIKDANISGNGTEDESYPQIWIKNSKVSLKNLEVQNGFGTGVYVGQSEVNMENIQVSKNKGNGIVIQDQNKVEIKRSLILNNGGSGIFIKRSRVEMEDIYVSENEGTGSELNSQVYIENSKVTLKNLKVEKGYGTGVYSKKSKVNIEDIEVSKNKKNGISIHNQSELDISKATIYKNGSEDKSYPQIWIQDSNVILTNCYIKNIIGKSNGIWIISGNVKIFNSKITKNRGGVGIKGNAEVFIENCKIYENGKDDYDDGIGVYDSKAIVTLKNVKTWGNKWGLSWNNKDNIKIIDCEFKDGDVANFSDCFITTAVVKYLNKPDNCYELNCLRKFRDEWLIKQDDGEQLVREYYQIAPQIVEAIEGESEVDRIYSSLWKDYISKCIGLIEKGDYEACKNLYIRMVEELKKVYLEDKNIKNGLKERVR